MKVEMEEMEEKEEDVALFIFGIFFALTNRSLVDGSTVQMVNKVREHCKESFENFGFFKFRFLKIRFSFHFIYFRFVSMLLPYVSFRVSICSLVLYSST